MFDPTVYENLKVVLEGSVYDLDLAGTIRITARQDLVDLASMSRTYRLVYELRDGKEKEALNKRAPARIPSSFEAELVLSTGLTDLAAEIMNLESDAPPGCSLDISFTTQMKPDWEPERVCTQSGDVLRQVWGSRFSVRHTISSDFGETSAPRSLKIRLLFGRRFGEEVVEDIPNILDHTVLTLSELTELVKRL